MKAQVKADWFSEAVELLSEGFTRKETIRSLIQDGCHPKVAIRTVNELIEDSRQLGWSTVKQGFIILLLTFIFAFAIYFFGQMTFPQLMILGVSASIYQTARGVSRIWAF